jgi:vacuolar-type H+-ATPase subunit F/Vma7
MAMTAAAYLGDEVSAAGWRLAGVCVQTPPAGDEAAALQVARTQAPLVLVSAAVASRIPTPALRAALAALAPLVLVVPDREGGVPMPDIATRLREQLGLQA